MKSSLPRALDSPQTEMGTVRVTDPHSPRLSHNHRLYAPSLFTLFSFALAFVWSRSMCVSVCSKRFNLVSGGTSEKHETGCPFSSLCFSF